MAQYTTQQNQTILDVCLIVYGTLDKLVKLCEDNDLTVNSPIYNGMSITYTGSQASNLPMATAFNTFVPDVYPTIVTEPVDEVMCHGQSMPGYLTVDVTGTVTNYQWQQYDTGTSSWVNVSDGGPISGSNTYTLFFDGSLDTCPAITYRCVITGLDSFGHVVTVISTSATLTCETALYVSIPTNFSNVEWMTTTIASSYTGSAPSTYQWQYSDDSGTTWVDITSSNAFYPTTIPTTIAGVFSNYTTDTLRIANIHRTMNNMQFRLKMTPGCPSTYSYSNTCLASINLHSVWSENYHDYVYNNTDTMTSMQINAIDQLYNDLTGVPNLLYPTSNILPKLKLVYLAAGTNALQQAIEIANLPTNGSGASPYELAFTGTVNHLSSGIQFTGTGSFAKTNFSPLGSGIATDNIHFSVYSQNDSDNPTPALGGVFTSDSYATTGSTSLIMSSGSIIAQCNSAASANLSSSCKSLVIANRIASGAMDINVRGVLNSYTPSSSTAHTANRFLLGAFNSQSGNNTLSFASVGNGLQPTEELGLYNAVQQYQTALARAV